MLAEPSVAQGIVIVSPAVYPRNGAMSKITILAILFPVKVDPDNLESQNLMQVSSGVPELCSDKQTDLTDKQRYNLIYIDIS